MESIKFICAAAFVVGSVIAILRDILGKPEKGVMRTTQSRSEDDERTAVDEVARQHRVECDAARSHLKAFYVENQDLFGDAHPPALFAAFLKTEMGEGLSPQQLWSVCREKINEFLPLVVAGKRIQGYLQL